MEEQSTSLPLPPSPQDVLLTPDEVSELLRATVSWVYANKTKLPGLLRLGRYVRLRKAAITTLLRGTAAQ
jgi:hypothetical protein